MGKKHVYLGPFASFQSIYLHGYLPCGHPGVRTHHHAPIKLYRHDGCLQRERRECQSRRSLDPLLSEVRKHPRRGRGLAQGHPGIQAGAHSILPSSLLAAREHHSLAVGQHRRCRYHSVSPNLPCGVLFTVKREVGVKLLLRQKFGSSELQSPSHVLVSR